MKTTRIRKTGRTTSRRRGSAPIELAFCLPFLVGAMSIIFTLGSAGVTKSSSVVAARHNSWKERNKETWQNSETLKTHKSDTPGIGALGLILMIADGYKVDEGVLEGKDERGIAVAYPGYVSKNLTTDSEHFVMGGAWDHRRLPSKDRGRMIPSNQFESLPFDGMPSMSGFGDILKADEIAGAGPIKDGSEIQEQLEKGKQEAEKKLQELRAKEDQLEQQLEDLYENGGSQAEINAVLSQLQQVRDEIKAVEEGLAEMEKAGGKLPG